MIRTFTAKTAFNPETVKTFLNLIWLTTLTGIVQAQGHWQNLGNFPGIARDDASGIVVNGNGYMGTGFGTGFVYLGDWWQYDFDQDSWTPKAALPGEPRQYTAIAAIENDIYLLGGITPLGCSDELWIYHTLTNEWELLTHFPAGGRQAPVLTAAGGKLYAGLGRCETVYYNDWWTFDPVTLTWTQLTPLPGEPRFDPVHAAMNESVVVGAGVSATGATNDCYEYMPVFGSWKRLADFPGCGTFYTAQAGTESELWVCGGADANYAFCPGFYQYTAGFYANQWGNWNIDALDPVRRGGVGFLYNNRFYYVCGLDSAGNRLSKVEYVNIEQVDDGSANNWVLYPSITSGDVFLESKDESDATFSLYNQLGQPVSVRIPVLFSHYLRLDVSHLPNGVYLLKIADVQGGKQAVRKFVKR